MTRRTLVTILIGILVAAVLGGLWLWFFSGSGTPSPQRGGTFGQGGTRSGQQQQTNTTPTNIPGQVSQSGQNTSTGIQGSIGAVLSGTPSVGGISSSSAPNVDWLAGGSGPSATGLASGSGTAFNPSAINQLNNGQVGGTVSVLGQIGTQGGGSGSNGNSGLAVGLIAGTAVACAAFQAQGQLAGLLPSLVVPTNDTTNNQKSFMDCLMRTIARAALQQITNSIVNWINSGFNGSPSFITNYQQFFASVADQAAGTFIANEANFAPFCTPFRNQIRIALAQSYARRGSIGPSCSLSTLLGTNIFTGKSTTGGNGWSNLLQFTTVPSNNPYGSYMSAQVQFQSTINSKLTNSAKNITPNGFINFQEAYDCTAAGDRGAGVSVGSGSNSVGYSCPSNCKCRTTTPGSVIESSLADTLAVDKRYLVEAGVSGSFDAILNALITQLTNRALYGGLSNLSGPTGYAGYYLTPDQQTAQAQGQYLLSNLQSLVGVAQQYGQSKQGSIQDVQAAQQQLNTLANCWSALASSTTDTSKSNLEASNAASALAALHSYDAQIALLNADITRANTAVALLQDLQTKTLNVGSTNDTAAIQKAFDADQAAGELIAQTELTQAQQDRSTLQAQLSSTNQQTAAQLQQCNATTV